MSKNHLTEGGICVAALNTRVFGVRRAAANEGTFIPHWVLYVLRSNCPALPVKLLMLSQRMKAFFRSSDLLFRFGGEEFVIILEPISHEMAERTLERFRNKVADSNFPLIEKITISGGYVKVTDLHYPVTFIEHADQALYYAKKNGRNCMYSYESLVERGELSKPIESGKIDLF